VSGADAQTQAASDPCGPGLFVRAPASEPVTAAFGARSYAAGDVASLRLSARAPARATLRLFHAGPGRPLRRLNTFAAVVRPARRLRLRASVRRVNVRIGAWPSGLYFALVQTPRGMAAAPFVLRASKRRPKRVAVVLPTNTLAAYNLRDTDRNGYGNSWYADPRVQTVDLRRPFLSGPLPQWPGRFVHWFAHSGYTADFYSDEDLDAVATGGRLASRYRLIVFAGHEEYATQHVFTIVKRYRDLGGNLAFLSANNFYRRVAISHSRMTCIGQFRDLGEPEAALVGVQYVDWWRRRYPSRPFVVRSVAAAPWLFRGTGLRRGDHFGRGYGIEIDARAPSSPPGTRVIAELPSIFGPGKTAQMTYYRTRAGAKVFAAGAMYFEGPQSPATARMLRNLWVTLRRR
jgi:N,N-dimethylformamidase beta subunit-like protein